ncbi:DUF3500 domain-containing protein (plasmid) [Novosphingobium sp. BL-8A]|uniref:DUF3500 domain-containing protein n=1 Tax=Novosphingobium sp. BL-8A TaxID=3127639 RepID=UPI0037566AA5
MAIGFSGLSLMLASCGGDDSSSSSTSSSTSTTTSTSTSSTSTSSSSGSSSASSGTYTTSTCSTTSGQGAYITCLATNYLATLSTTQQTSSIYTLSQANATNYWSNLPTTFVTRHGLALSALTDTQKEAAEALLAGVLSTQGQTTMANLRAADEYLKNNGGGSDYGEDLYYVSFLGTPSTSSAWILEFTGHHYTFFYALDASNAPVSLTPNFVGVEPKSYTSGSSTLTPMASEHDAMKAVLDSFSTSQLAAAKLSTSVSDLVVGPQADGKYPSTQSGIAVSALDSSQQDLVKAAIATYASDANGTGQYDAYVASSALGSTYISWSNYSDLATQGSYMRIDGPRIWIEFSVQSGVVFSATHYHTVWRDKTYDYGGNFSF